MRDKANDVLNLAQEVLTADVLLPHFVSIMETLAENSSQVKAKTSALEILNLLIKK